jgi:hypothetical protein
MLGDFRLALGAVFVALAATAPAAAQDFNGFSETRTPGLFSIFDEVRIGALTSIQSRYDSGVVLSGQLYFRPFGSPSGNYLVNTFPGRASMSAAISRRRTRA